MLDEILVKPEEMRVVSINYVCREGKDIPVQLNSFILDK